MIFVFKCTYSHFILVLMLICIFLKRFLITRAVRHRVKVSAPVLFLEFFLVHAYLNMQTSITCILGLVTCHLNQSNMAASAGQSSCFE